MQNSTGETRPLTRAQARPPLGGLRKLAFALVTCGLLLLATEAGLRASGLCPPTDAFFMQDATDDRHVSDPQLFWRLNPGLTRQVDDGGTPYRWAVNRQGFRADRPTQRDKRPGVTRILCLGDSIPFGWGVERAQAYPHLLEQKLMGSSGRVEVINAAVPGYSSHQVRRYFERLLEYRPDVVVVHVGVNDGNPATVEDHRREGVSLRRHPLQDLALVRLGQKIFVPVSERFRCYMGEYQANLEAIASGCRERGISLILLLPIEVEGGRLLYCWPPLRDTSTAQDYERRYWTLARGRLYVDQMETLRRAAAGRPERLYLDEGPFSCHLSAAGHEALATELARRLREAGFGRR